MKKLSSILGIIGSGVWAIHFFLRAIIHTYGLDTYGARPLHIVLGDLALFAIFAFIGVMYYVATFHREKLSE